ncbi:MAG: D-alanyl-D-alanine carboxypeptidase family protein [Pseudomonadota bacterium]
MKSANKNKAFLILLFVLIFIWTEASFMFLNTAFAQESGSHKKASKKHRKHVSRHSKKTHIAYAAPRVATIIVDYDSGKVLQAENADSLHYPASLTKMMTLYLTFEALKKGNLNLNQTIPISETAASQPQTNISLAVGERLAVKDAILSVVVRSANDSAVALGEAIGGSVSGFAQKMTKKAQQLGMKNTVFRNPSGLPDNAQHTTARDMALLGIALKRDFPQYFPFFKTESFSFNGKTYVTHNHVMMRYDGVDGIKTGFIRASGFNLVTSVNRDGHRLVAVVLGGSTWRARDDRMIGLLDRTFTQLASVPAGKTQLAASIKNRKAANVSGINNAEEELEGEGDQTQEK